MAESTENKADGYLQVQPEEVKSRSDTYHQAVAENNSNEVERVQTDVTVSTEDDSTKQESTGDDSTKEESKEASKKGKEAAKEAAKDDAMGEVNFTEHQMEIDEVAKLYSTSTDVGLSDDVIEEHREKYGKNVMSEIKQTPEWIKFLLCLFGDGFSLLLWLGAVLCFIAFIVEIYDDAGGETPKAYRLSGPNKSDVGPDNLFLGSVLFLVVLITGIFQYFQEKKSSDTMKKFKKMIPTTTLVTRSGKQNTIDPADLVVGDLITVKTGDKVPADIRIIQSSGMKVDNASLTGESEPQRRVPDLSDESRGIDAGNIAFFTTQCVGGSAQGIVIRTGDATVIGTIQNLVGTTAKKQTPIRTELIHFIHLISGVAIFLGVTFFIIALTMRVYSAIRCVIFLIAIIVANVPEGLLATVTVTLTIAAMKMASKKVLIKTLESVETLGSTSCIASDKTGTLTQNKMTVVHVMFDGFIWKCSETLDSKLTGDDEKDDIDLNNPTYKQLWTMGQLCNVTEYIFNEKTVPEEPGNYLLRDTQGDASESAILKRCDDIAYQANQGNMGNIEEKDFYCEAKEYRTKHKRVLNIPFDSKHKFAGVVYDMGGEQLQFMLKGAPERIIDRCDKIMINGEIVELTAEHRAAFDKRYGKLASEGERVLGFAFEPLSTSDYPKDFEFQNEMPYNGLCADDHKSLVFVGLNAIVDPPREAVPQAIKDCQSGGIQIIMVTGDHPETAKAIAKSIGIIASDTAPDKFAKENETTGKKWDDLTQEEQWNLHDQVDAIVVKGPDLEKMSEDDLDRILKHSQIVFARTSPAQKLRIVQGCQRNGKIVAVTGDGVNDSPALKAADIGCAMGIAGSDVAKEAADMILLNDDFSSIVAGVEQGRIVFDNLKKSIAYTLTSNIPEIAPFLFMIIFQVPLPLSTIMILAIDLGTDMYPAISMAYEGPESDIMKRKPRDPKSDNLVTLKLLQYTYMQIGIIQACAGFFCYFVVLASCGFSPKSLFDDEVGPKWPENTAEGSNEYDQYESITDDYGQEHDVNSRMRMLRSAQTSYFTSIVIVQWADLLICKTRVLSLFQQGLRNGVMNKALVFETVLAIFLVYTPGMTSFFQTGWLIFRWWLPALSFSALILLYDEIRKYIIRRDRRNYNWEKTGKIGWVEKVTYY